MDEFKKPLTEIMETEAGRAFVRVLLILSGIEEGGFAQDPNLNAYISGKRAIGAIILEALRSTERGSELEAIMRREARNPPQEEKADSFYRQFITGDEK